MKKIIAFMLSAVLALAMTACGEKPARDNPGSYYTFQDSLGNRVSLSEKPKKVAVLFSSYADIWNLSGGSVDITVGESVERGFASDECLLVDSGSGHSSIDLESLVARQPDLVIGTADYESQVEAVDFCRQQGIPAASFKVEIFEDYLSVLRIFCDINQNEDAYQQYGTQVRESIDEIFQNLPRDRQAKKILFIRSGSGASSAKAKTYKENFACAMLKELGTENIAEQAPALLDGLSLEEILVSQPDYIFITTMGDEQAAKDYIMSLFESEGWRRLDAVKNGNYAFLPKDLFHYKPNASWDKAYGMLAELLYGENR